MSTEVKYRLKFMFQKVDIQSREFIIGRGLDCNLVLEDPLVSRNHARIRIATDHAVIDDLGSRNGTLVNNSPVFNNHILANNDRIRIGSHDILFLVERPGLSRSLRTTGAMITCNSCKVPLPLGLSQCPHCQAPIGHRIDCPRCGESVSPTEKYCPRCRTRLRTGDPTVPIGLGGEVEGWTDSMVSEVIDKAISQNRWDHAARALSGKMENYEIRRTAGQADIPILLQISRYNLVLAEKLDEPERIEWIVSQWQQTGAVMPADLFQELLQHEQALNILQQYLASIRDQGAAAAQIEQLERIWSARESSIPGA